MPRRKVLFISHGHPEIRPGGTEVHALELYEAMRASPDFEPTLLCRTGPPHTTAGPHLGTLLSRVGDDPNQLLVYTDPANFDWLRLTLRGKEFYTHHYRHLLTTLRPDVVHFQHTVLLGLDLITETRRTLPDAALVFTLHEYAAICHRDGTMLRTHDDQLCHTASPRRCNECFPDISAQSFFLRQRFAQAHFELIDLFIAPSHFLRQQYIAWGIPSDKIVVEPNGRRVQPVMPEAPTDRLRDRFGFFGQLTKYKGVSVLLKAMELLDTSPGDQAQDPAPTTPHLWMHGANLDIQPEPVRVEIQAALDRNRDRVTFVGPYAHRDVGRLMAHIDWVVVPSIWWENAPMVIQEAFMHGRPVICSDIGGMAEAVTHGVDGLHFRVGDPWHLAEVIRSATGTPGLWQQLRAGIQPVRQVEATSEHLSASYLRLLARSRRQHVGVAP